MRVHTAALLGAAELPGEEISLAEIIGERKTV